MKLLTLNTHSLVEDNYPQKLEAFVEGIAAEKPQIIALQEVNQSISAMPAEATEYYHPCCGNAVIKCNNYVYRAAQLLREKGLDYYWTWLPIKKGYGQYDEGIAVMSLSPVLETDILTVSDSDDYENWKTRRLLGVRTEALPDEWFFSVHYGWWGDPDEPFRHQWIRTAEHMTRYDSVWLMGDFNAPASIRGAAYDLVKRSFWQDTYELAQVRDSGATVSGSIDGWKDAPDTAEAMRIDQIWCNKKVVITSSEVVFNGTRHPVVSDHFGVMVSYERSLI